MKNKVRVVFNRRKQASESNCAAVEIVVCFGRERFYFSTGIFLNLTQWEDGTVINHSESAQFNEQIKKKVIEFEHIIVAMGVNGDEMNVAQFKTYLTVEGGNRRNFMAWMRERMEKRQMRDGTRKGHVTTYKALQRFGKFKTFDDVTLPRIYEFDLFLREEETFTSTGKPVVRSQAAIHNYHKRFKSYVSEAYRLGLIKDNPYTRFSQIPRLLPFPNIHGNGVCRHESLRLQGTRHHHRRKRLYRRETSKNGRSVRYSHSALYEKDFGAEQL